MPWRRTGIAHIARSLAHSVDAKGGYMPGHSDGVAYLIGTMAAEAGMDAIRVGRLEMAAMVHDVGKLFVPDDVLLAPRRLTSEEFDRIKPHADWGGQMCAHLHGLEFAAPWVRHHHERWDGFGYPDGLAGEEIPWEARLISVADAFHVITTDRPYQLARTRGEAIEILQTHSGSQFDPIAVELLLSRQGGPSSLAHR